MTSRICEYCGASTPLSTVLKDRDFEHEQARLTIQIHIHECLLCGGKWEDSALTEMAQNKAIEDHLKNQC